jgi:hypothetical protein
MVRTIITRSMTREIEKMSQFSNTSTFRIYDTPLTKDTYLHLSFKDHYAHRLATAVFRKNMILQVFPHKIYYNNVDEWVASWPKSQSLFREGYYWEEDCEQIPIK